MIGADWSALRRVFAHAIVASAIETARFAGSDLRRRRLVCRFSTEVPFCWGRTPLTRLRSRSVCQFLNQHVQETNGGNLGEPRRVLPTPPPLFGRRLARGAGDADLEQLGSFADGSTVADSRATRNNSFRDLQTTIERLLATYAAVLLSSYALPLALRS